MTPELEQLVAFLDAHDLTRLEYERGDLRVVLERQPAPTMLAPGAPLPVAPAAPATPIASAVSSPGASSAAAPLGTPAPAAPAAVTVTAPLVGIAYRSREPGAAPLIEPGQTVAEGDVLCLIEAMKLFNEITAPVAGVIGEILFEDADLAEYGAPLVTILPAIPPATD
jgi:acetyl-CoA carboxylase biotin carboxyl carrier protein